MSDFFGDVDVVVEVAFGDDPLAVSPTWTDITDYVRGFNTNRGRSSEFMEYSPGMMSVVLDNNDRRFDTDYASSPYVGNLQPMKRIRVVATAGGVDFSIYTGFVLGWPQSFRDKIDATVTVSCVDGTRFLERSPLAPSPLAGEILADEPMRYWPLQPQGENVSNFPALVGSSPIVASYGAVSADVGLPVAGSVGVSEVDFLLEGTGSAGTLESAPRSMEVWLTLNTTLMRYTADNNDRIPSYLTLRAESGVADYLRIGYGSDFLGGSMWNCYYQRLVGGSYQLGFVEVTSPEEGVYHLAATASATTLYLWINGKLAGSGTLTTGSAVANNGPPLQIRLTPPVEESETRNYISHVAVYDEELTEARIQAHYNAGRWGWGHPFGERSGARCERVLDQIGWPDALRDIDTGDTVHGPYLPATQSALSYLRSVETAEEGALYFRADGRLRFRGRAAKWDGIGTIPLLADDGEILLADDDEILLSDLELIFGPDDLPFDDIALDGNSVDPIRNIVAASYATGYLKVSDATSVTAYGDSDETLSLPTVDSAVTARGLASYRLRQRKDPKTRVPQLTIKPRSLPADLFVTVLDLELGDLIGVGFDHPSGIGDPLSYTLTVQGIAHDVRASGEWVTTLYVAPADEIATDAPYLIAGDATYGRIGAAAGNKVPF